MSLIVSLRDTVNLEDKQKGKSINRWRISKKAIRKEPNFSVKPAGSQILERGCRDHGPPPHINKLPPLIDFHTELNLVISDLAA